VFEEEILTGGNMTDVVRVGDTVRRKAGPWTPAIHALLEHIRQRGFVRAPVPLGYDEQGRENISLLPGSVAAYPLDDYVLSDKILQDVARMLREYHDASADFVPPAGTQWQWPVHEPREVLCHNDFAPYNLLFANGGLTGVIDFDTASPGPRAWDIAYAAYRFVPLTDPANEDVRYPGLSEQRRRLRLFCETYGAPENVPRRVVTTAIERLRELVEFIVTSAQGGDLAQQAVLARGDTKIYERDIAYLESHVDGLAGV
jgi:hypothetical protein